MGLGRVRSFPMRPVTTALVLAALLAAPSAFALAPSLAYSPNGGTVTPGDLRGTPSWRTWATQPPGAGGVSVADRLIANLGLGSAQMYNNRVLTWPNVVRGAIAAGRLVTPLGAGLLVYGLWESGQCQITGSAAPYGITCDFGTDTVTVSLYTGTGGFAVPSQCGSGFSVVGQGSTVPAAGADSATKMAAAKASCSYPTANGSTSLGWSYTVDSCAASSCVIRRRQDQTNYYNSGANPVVFTPVYHTTTIPYSLQNTQQCPPINGTPPQVRADGKCPTGSHSPATEPQAEEQLQALGNPANARDIAQQAAEHVDLAPYAQPDTNPLTGPSTVTEPVRTTTNTDANGNTTTTTSQTVHNVTYNNHSYSYTTSNVTTNPDGSTTEETGTEEVETCGLPGTPPCKIDEAGTPPPRPPDAYDAIADGLPPAVGAAVAAIEVPSTEWSWSFSLPSGCSGLNVGEFAGTVVSINPCEYQSMIHDIMSILWIGATIFGAVGMVGRTLGGS